MDFKYPYTDAHELNLDWFLEEFKNVMSNVSSQDQKITTLEGTVEQFTTFVTNYFNNLDVQQEINNKLNVMAANGQLQAMLQPYFDQFVESVDNQITTQNNKLTTLESRMNEFTTLTDGSTTGDAELADIRIGFNGITYQNAGEAVRKCDIINNDMADTSIKNINNTELFGTKNWTSGSIGESGNIVPSSRYAYSDIFSVLKADYISYILDYNTQITYAYVAEYDVNNTFLRRIPFHRNYKYHPSNDCISIRFIFGVASGETLTQTIIDDYFGYLVVNDMHDIYDIKGGVTLSPIARDGYAVSYSDGSVYVSNFQTADVFIPKTADQIYYPRITTTSSTSIAGIAFYDINSNYISGQRCVLNASGYGVEWTVLNIPVNATLARFTYFTTTSQINLPLPPLSVIFGNNISECISLKLDRLEKQIKYSASSLGLHEIPKNDGVLNIIKRCRQMTDIEWTPAVDLPRFMYVSTTPPYDSVYDDDMAAHYIGVFKAGTKYKGIPYGRCATYIDSYGYSNTYVGHNVPIESFVTAVQNPESIISKESAGSISDHRSIPFALVCSALTTYALNVPYVSTGDIPNINGLNFVTHLKVGGVYISPNLIQLGDVLNITGFHTAIITDLIRDTNGDVIYIEESEATTVGEADPDYEGGQTGGICRRVGFSVNDFFARFGSYDLYRYANAANVPYTPNKYVNVGDEFNMARLDRLPVMPYLGEGFAYKSGHIVNSKLVITTNDYNYLRVFKDGVEMAASPFTVSGSTVDVGFSATGEYTAYLCNMSGNDNTSVSAICHWTVI